MAFKLKELAHRWLRMVTVHGNNNDNNQLNWQVRVGGDLQPAHSLKKDTKGTLIQYLASAPNNRKKISPTAQLCPRQNSTKDQRVVQRVARGITAQHFCTATALTAPLWEAQC